MKKKLFPFNNYAPIVLFTYDRPDHVRAVLNSLKNNEEAKESALIVYSDAPKNKRAEVGVKMTRELLKDVTGFKKVTIIERSENYGLANNIIEGISSVLCDFDRVIVLEDDHLVSPFFLKYMNEALVKYENDEKVASIHGYVYPCKEELPPLFFIKGADCWSWATWKRAWKVFNPNGQELLDELRKRKLEKEFDFGFNANYVEMLIKQIAGKNSSWAVRWYASTFLADMYTLYPGRSMMRIIGADGSGTHGAVTNSFDVNLNDAPIDIETIPSNDDNIIGRKAFESFFNSLLSSKLKLYKYLCLLFNKRILTKYVY